MRWKKERGQQLCSHWREFPGRRFVCAYLSKKARLVLGMKPRSQSLLLLTDCPGCFSLGLKAHETRLRAAGASRHSTSLLFSFILSASLYSPSSPIFHPWCACVLGNRGESKYLSVFTKVAWSFGHIWNTVWHHLLQCSQVSSHLCWGTVWLWAERRWPQAVGIEAATWVEECPVNQSKKPGLCHKNFQLVLQQL